MDKREYNRQWKKLNKDKVKEHARKYREKLINDPERLAKHRTYYRDWYAKNGRNRNDDFLEMIYEYREEHPDRERASRKLRFQVKMGKIIKPKYCDNCKEERKLVGHHEDYSKPLDVVWLCASCHKLRHKLGIDN